MKLLTICCRIPALECKGDQSISYSRLKFLRKHNYEIQVICYGNPLNVLDSSQKSELEKIGIKVHLIRWSPIFALINIIFATTKDIKIPFQCAIFKSKKFKEKISEIIQTWEPDALYAVLIRIAENIPNNYQGNLFLDLIDSMALNFSRKTESYTGLTKLFLKNEAKRVKLYEKTIADISKVAFVVSKIDASIIDSKKIVVIPLGIDLKKIRVNRIQSEQVVIFSGNMNYEPNIKSIEWFINNCWNTIQTKFPMAKLMIVGSNPKNRVVKLAKKGKRIQVKGFVNSMSLEISKATVAIAPMQLGSGMQFKILEAMACGVPVVTTTLGLGDISATKNEAILIAETPYQFSKHIINLIENNLINNKIGAAGYRYVKEYHDLEMLNHKFLYTIEKSCQKYS